MEPDERRRDVNCRGIASRSGSMDSNSTARPVEGFSSAMDIDESKGGSGHDGQSGRVHKGGRKLIYATLEERKERNRQAQATFRERRIIYVAQLEKTIQEQRDELRRLQDACSSATDERLNLKYKNSLLERILLEKGIEVRAELEAEVPLPPKKISKSRQPSIRRAKSTAICRRHSSITSEPMDLSEVCRCNPSVSYMKNSSNSPSTAEQSGHHVTERKHSLQPNMIRWQQTHGTQAAGNSPSYDSVATLDNSMSHLGKYLPTHPPPIPSKNPLVLDLFHPLGPEAQQYHGYAAQYHVDSAPHSPASSNVPQALSSHYSGPRNHLEHLELEWSHLLPAGAIGAGDDDAAGQDNYGPPDNATSGTHHSSPISTVRTPPDFSPPVGHVQQFGKQLAGAPAACYDMDEAAVAYHGGFGMVQDPFGLDASLFSI